MSEKTIALNGRLITSQDPLQIGDGNFQSLINMRYTDSYPKGIGGMTKINTTALAAPKTRNGFHYFKDQPSESHVLVQSYNAGETTSYVYENTTVIPGAGDFSATAIHTDSDTGTGRFSSAPDGMLAYCNGDETLIWGGDEFRCVGFINYDPGGTFKYDFSDVISNTLTDADNIATLSVNDAGIDANTMLMLHLNNNVTDDSPATAHTVTNNNVTFTTTSKFGSHAGVFNGTNATLTVPDDADFDFSDGTWSFDAQVKQTSLALEDLYWQETDATNYIVIYLTAAGAVGLQVVIAGSADVDLTTADAVITAGTFQHIEVSENGDDYYIFVDGELKASVTDTDRAADYTGTVTIGNGPNDYFTGVIDEIRIRSAAGHTADFEPPSVEYSSLSVTSYIYFGSLIPVNGMKLYIQTANTATGTMAVDYWSGSAWTATTTLTDGTTSGGVSLAQTGSITFDDTSSLSKIKVIDNKALYWYRMTVDTDGATQIYYATSSAVMQDMKDVWDGAENLCLSFQKFDGSKYNDLTSAVSEEDYSSANTATYADTSSLTSVTDYLIAGFTERQLGISITFVVDKTNTTAATLATVYYWNGSGWVSVGTVDDSTRDSSISFAKSGTITWNQPAKSSEFKTTIARDIPLYYYKVEFDQNLSANVFIDKLTGISGQNTIKKHSFPFHAQERLWLCDETDGERNSVICSAKDTFSVFNGEDSTKLYFGGDSKIVAATDLSSNLGSSIYDIIVFCKQTETHILIGNSLDTWTKFRVSRDIGCAAPLTMKTAIIEAAQSPFYNKTVAIWQSANGIYLFDGRNIHPIHNDIEDIFDRGNTSGINRDMIGRSVAEVENSEYRWCFASGTSTTLDTELVFDLKRLRWYQVDRGSDLQAVFSVKDTSGNTYSYGTLTTGYMERLENGTDFDGTAISHTLWTGEVLPFESFNKRSKLRHLRLWTKSKTTTTSSISCTNYIDTESTGEAQTLSTNTSGRRVTHVHSGWNRQGLTHSFKFTISTDNETSGFEPSHLTLDFENMGEFFN